MYIWRCAKCSYHFSNITQVTGSLMQEKKCPKCKSLNKLTLNNKQINIVCDLASSEEDESYYNNKQVEL